MAATFTVNHRTVTVEQNQNLLRYLRDTLRLTSVKDGCSEGACGTCTVVIDGRAVKACVQQTDRLQGKEVLTVEGLSDFEKEAFVYAFGTAGAVQCGFCIPGMVMCAKALLDRTPDPDEAADRPCAARQHLPLHRLCEDHRGGAHRRRRAARRARARGRDELAHGRARAAAGRAREGARLRRVYRRHRAARHALRLRRAQQISARARAGHPHRAGKGAAGRGVRAHGRRRPVPAQGRPPQARLGRDDRRGADHALPGRRRGARRGRNAGDPRAGQGAGRGRVRGADARALRGRIDGRGRAAAARGRQPARAPACAPRRRGRGHPQRAARALGAFYHAVHRARLPRAGMRRGAAVRRRRRADLVLGPERVRHPARDLPHARPAAGAGARGEQACRRRLRRQGGRDGAAPRGADRLPAAPPGQGEAHAGREHPDPSQAPPDGHGLHPRLRRAGQHPRRQGAGRGRYGRVRLARRAGARARVHARGRAVPL